MISFKTKEDTLPSVLIILAILIALAAAVYWALFPVPDIASVAKASNEQQFQLRRQIRNEEQDADLSRAQIGARLWNGDSNHVGADVLALVTTSTSLNNVKLAAFRPLKQVDLNGVVQLPYTVQLSGPFSGPDDKGVRAVMRNLDDSKSKVVLNSVQINSSEENAGAVTATLGISAYIATDPLIASNIPQGGKSHAEVHQTK